MQIEILEFREIEKNTLRGFLTLRIADIGLEIRDCPVHEKGDKRWVGLPARPFTGKDGTQQWQMILKFDEGEPYWTFQNAVLEALEKRKPAATGFRAGYRKGTNR